jgi:hypothetical protein
MSDGDLYVYGCIGEMRNAYKILENLKDRNRLRDVVFEGQVMLSWN